MNLGVLTRYHVADLLAAGRKRSQPTFGLFMPVAESGTETRLRLFFQRRHVKVTAQVDIDEVGRVDMLVGKRLIIEADSQAHHTSSAQYANDRRRDLAATRLGYRVVRLTWEQVFITWEATQQSLADLIQAGAHR